MDTFGDQPQFRFYGINLNTSVVLEQIGYAGKTGSSWEKIYNISTGNLIITALGFVPGYWVTILTVEYIGRKKIQLIGFLMEALFCTSLRRASSHVLRVDAEIAYHLAVAILAGKFHTLSKPAFIVCFALLQFFFNFGANSTTFVRLLCLFAGVVPLTKHTIQLYPAEVFPTRFRASAHGLSAAAGKLGAIISSLAFNSLSKKVGTPIVLWSACCQTRPFS